MAGDVFPAGRERALPANGGRRVFIGDVQGCDDELGDLLARLELVVGRDELWFAGDLVNRGPRSLAALRRVCRIATGTVLGNHDLHLLGVATGQRALRPGDTLDEVLAAPDRDELLAWLASQPLLVSWSDLVLVHAGLHPRWDSPEAVAERLEGVLRTGRIPFEDPELRFLTTARSCDAQGRLPASDGADSDAYRPWDAFYAGPRRVVFGHWAARGLVSSRLVRGVDSGCVWGGELSAWIAEEDRFVSVPARRTYRQWGRGG